MFLPRTSITASVIQVIFESLAHFRIDCAPNVRKKRAGRALLFYTTKDVVSGEELCINYIDLTDSVAERRKQLSANWYFDCVCERCKKELESQ